MVDRDNEKLITLIKREPSIWNINSRDFLHKNLRLEAWHRIGSKLTADWLKRDPKLKARAIYTIKNRWTHIKNSYIKDKSNNDPGKKKCCRYDYLLGFLDPVLGSYITCSRKGRSVSRNVTIRASNDELKDGEEDAKCKDQNVIVTDCSSNDETMDEEQGSECPEKSQDLNHTSIVCEPDAPNNLTAQSMLQWNEMSSDPQSQLYSHTKRKNAPTGHWTQQTIPSFLGVNPNVAFLISCAQEMEELTPFQRLEFKSGAIDLIKSIKYSNEDLNT